MMETPDGSAQKLSYCDFLHRAPSGSEAGGIAYLLEECWTTNGGWSVMSWHGFQTERHPHMTSIPDS